MVIVDLKLLKTNTDQTPRVIYMDNDLALYSDIDASVITNDI